MSRRFSPTSSRASSPTHSRLGSRSPGRSPAKSVVRSPTASRASLLVDGGGQNDQITASQVLHRISGLMCEMTAMESSLGNLREELDAAAMDEGAELVPLYLRRRRLRP